MSRIVVESGGVKQGTMKFWQRQFLLGVGFFCFVVVFILHSRTPDDTDRLLLESNRRDAQTFLSPREVTLGARADPKEEEEKKQPGGSKDELYKDDAQEKNSTTEDEASRKPPVTYVNQTTSTDCPHLLRPENVQETHVFQKVDGSLSLLEFSAFLDQAQSVVRIVGLSVTLFTSSPSCLLWYRPDHDDKELRVVAGKLVRLPEHHSRKYSAHYIECPLPQSPTKPYAVSVTSKDCRGGSSSKNVKVIAERPSNVLPVLQPPEEPRRNFTVCVTALNYRYSRAYELVEMIELNRLLGADSFTFYVHSVGDNVQKVLRWYQQRGVVQLVDWPLPMEVDHWPPAKKPPEVHYFAQLASHNDCLNRHRGLSRYLVYQDLDEFIIPKKTTTWTQLLASLKDKGSGYGFRCVFFRKDWPPNSENFTGRATADKFRSIVLATDKREPNLFSFSQRAKYIVDPRLVQIVGIHNVWTLRGPKTRMVPVDPSHAVLHHYRGWENPKDVGRAVRDTDVYRFKEALLARLQERWGQLPQVPLDIPLSHYGQV